MKINHSKKIHHTQKQNQKSRNIINYSIFISFAIVTIGLSIGIAMNLSKPEYYQNDVSNVVSRPKPKPTCDGISIKSNCVLDNINYKTYVYHSAVPEKSHIEQVTTYEKKVIGYCTLCNDGTYSPSCATGRGACSHRGGVAQWNAPEYNNVPVYSTKTVVDAPAQAAYYEKVTE